MDIQYKDFFFDDALLNRYREQLYGSDQNGYVLLKDFIPPNVTEHIQRFWTEIINHELSHEKFSSKTYHYGDKNVYNFSQHQPPHYRAFHNFLWNYPDDEVTHQVAYLVMMLINQVERKPIYKEIFPQKIVQPKDDPVVGQSVSYRVVQTIQDHAVPEHKDYAKGDPDYFAPEKLQATLFLSQFGKDYQKGGMYFDKNTGERIKTGQELDIKAGDLLLWRYSNAHGVEGVESEDNELGFMRIIFPREFIYQK